MDDYTKLAKNAIEVYVKTGKIISPPGNLPLEFFKKRAGSFVSLHKKDGSLRGCIGTFLPAKQNLAHEIINNAICASTEDPRFTPVREDELNDLEISVDVLSVPQPVTADFSLDPKKYGLIVSAADGRRGLLLPDIPGVNTPQEQESICRQKAGINQMEPVSREIFSVDRHL